MVLIALLFVPSSARAQTDPRGYWRTWHTPHFRVHARAEHAAVAILAAREAERAYAALARELVPPRGTVELVLYDNVDFANGFTTVFPRNQIAIYLTSPAGEAGLARYDDWVRLVITHELTHVFHLDRSAGIWGLTRRVFGRAPGLFPNAYRPSWVGEGLAVYYESRLTNGGRLRGGFHAQVLTSAGAAGRWPGPDDATFASAKWPAGLGPYAFGSRFMEWESRTYGAEVVPRFVESSARRLWPLQISGPLARAGGERLRPAWKKFRERWTPDSTAGEPGRVLVRGLRVDPRVQVSADGRWIAYVDADGRRTNDVVVRDAATWAEAGRHRVTGEVELTWAGPELVIAQLDFRAPVEIRSALYRWGPGRAWRRESPVNRLTRPFLLGESRVGAVQLRTASVMLVWLTHDGVEPLAAPPAADWSRIAASPDANWIAGARHDRGRWDIVLWPAGAPARARALTSDDALDEDPTWTHDGSMVVFTSERLGLPQIFGVRTTTNELVQFTREPTGARGPAVSPVGTLYYTTILADGYAVVSRRLASQAPEPAAAESELPFVPAPDVPVRETRYSTFGALLPRWWWPAAHDGGSAGRFLGLVTSGSDQVGRLGYVGGLAHSIDNPRWEWRLGLGYTRWGRLVLDASASQTWGSGGRVVATNGRTYSVDERDMRGSAGATVRWRGWRWDASFRMGAEIEREERLVADSVPLRFLNPTLAGGVASFRLARSDSRALAISSENGIALSGLYRRRWALVDRRWLDELHGSLRTYLALPFPGFARWVIAVRVAGAVSGGTRTARTFGLGGESSDFYTPLPGLSVGGGFREFPLRGYPRSSFGYTRVAVGAAELRIPLFLIAKGVPHLPLAIDKVSLSLFGETGGGWDPGDPVDATRFRDVGAELVTDWGLNYDTPLRVRVGVGRGLTTWINGLPGGTRWYVALGSAF